MSKKYKELWMVDEIAVQEGKDKRSFWTRVGVAYENRDGSYTLEFQAMPMSGHVLMKDPKKKDK